MEKAKLDAKKKLIALPEHASALASWLESLSRGGHKLSNGAITKSYVDAQFSQKRKETLKGSKVGGPSNPVKPVYKSYPEN